MDRLERNFFFFKGDLSIQFYFNINWWVWLVKSASCSLLSKKMVYIKDGRDEFLSGKRVEKIEYGTIIFTIFSFKWMNRHYCLNLFAFSLPFSHSSPAPPVHQNIKQESPLKSDLYLLGFELWSLLMKQEGPFFWSSVAIFLQFLYKIPTLKVEIIWTGSCTWIQGKKKSNVRKQIIVQ